MLKIVIPANMEETTLEHLRRAGRPVSFMNGQDFGRVESTGDEVVRLRSYDIPTEVLDSCDVGLCGRDWVIEQCLELRIRPEILESYGYGRQFSGSPTLDLVAPANAGIKRVEDIKAGSVIMTEYPNLTREFLKRYGFKTARFGRNHQTPSKPDEFRNWCREEDTIGIRTVHGRIAALVCIGAGLGVMVNETGRTLEKNKLVVIGQLLQIETVLIVDPEAIKNKGDEVDILRADLNRAYLSIRKELEGSQGSPERFPG